MKSLDDWEDDFEDNPGGTLLKVIIYIVVFVVLLTLVIWGLMTHFSYWWGQQGAEQQKNSTQNFISAQAAFEQEDQDYTKFQQEIVTARYQVAQHNAQAVPTDPLSSFQFQQQTNNLETNLTGLQQQCRDTVSTYNAQSKEFLSQDWKSTGLPPTLDSSGCN